MGASSRRDTRTKPGCRPSGRTIIALGLLIAGLFPGLPVHIHAAPFDFTGPITAISASPGANFVTLDALDPDAGGLITANISSGSTSDLITAGGVAAWSSASRVHFYIYDPFARNWVGGNINAGSGTTFDLRNTNGVVAWTIGSTARYAAYDWTRSRWVTDSAPIGAPATSLDIIDGIVAGSSGAGVFYAAYDPRAGSWMKGSAAIAAGQFVNLANASGLVVWTAGNTVQCRAYDPLSGAWKGTTANLNATPFDLKTAGGIAAWTHTPAGGTMTVSYIVYDGPRATWSGESVASGYTSDLTVSNSTVVWTTTTQAYRRGYNALAGTWTANVSTPRAYFLASTNSGNAPFTVAFIDLSLGGNAWAWNFGTGAATSTRRSPFFRFTTFGQYLVTETVSGPGGVSTTNLLIRTDTVPPSGTVTINNGDAVTTNINVSLQLSANDNGGPVASMRFSNDSSIWSDWENYSPAKAWTLAPNTGLKSVYAQFRDVAGNVSTNAVDTIQLDTTPPPTLSFVSTNILENAGSIVVQAVLDHAVNRPVSASYSTSDGTAANGEDYTGQSGLLLFPANITTVSISIPILSDPAVELDETILLNLSNPTNALVTGPGTVTIVDDDRASIAFAAANFNVSEDAGIATVAIRLNAASGQTVSVRVLAQPGSATDGQDFVSTNALLVFQPGQTNRTFNIPLLDDLADELTETISLSLTNLTNGVIGVPAQSTVSILDNDQPFISFSADTYSGFEDEFSITVSVRLSKPFGQQVSAGYTIFGGTATPGLDYTVLGTVIIPAGTTNATITLFPINDGQREADETIRLRLTDIAGAAPGRTETMVSILDEDGAPRFLSPRHDGGTFRATARGSPNLDFTIQTSTNLVNWTFLQSLTTSASGTVEFSAPASAPNRFYRTFVSP